MEHSKIQKILHTLGSLEVKNMHELRFLNRLGTRNRLKKARRKLGGQAIPLL
jgi:hypothetical protein